MGDFGKDALVADVDCTADGKPLCEKVGVKGYPTLKWGDPNALEDYSGGRTFADLKKFAKENLKPICSPANIDLCDEEKKKQIAEIQAMPAEDTFTEEVKKLQDTYSQLQKDKDEAVAAVKKSGLGLMQAVHAHAQKGGGKEEL